MRSPRGGGGGVGAVSDAEPFRALTSSIDLSLLVDTASVLVGRREPLSSTASIRNSDVLKILSVDHLAHWQQNIDSLQVLKSLI